MEREVETMEEKIWVKELLDDVRKDAIRKSLGKSVTEQVYYAIIEMVKLAKVAGKEGLLALEEAMRDDLEAGKLESDLNNITVLSMGIAHIVDGTEDYIIAEILTTKYWVKNPQGMEALAYYIYIQGIIMIKECLPAWHLEALLTALLPEECMAEYERRKEEKIPEQTPKTLMEMLMEKELNLPRQSIIIRNALEEKLAQVTESVIKICMQKLNSDDNGAIAIVMRGLSKTYREKLLSCMSSIRRNNVLETEAYMGPVLTADIEDAMVKFLECLEEALTVHTEKMD